MGESERNSWSRRSVMAAGAVPWLVAPAAGSPDAGSDCADAPGGRRRPARAHPAKSTYSVSYIPFQDVAPSYLTLTESWNALGMDDSDRVYIIWTSTRDDGRGDSALFRYTPATKKKEFLGSFIDVATKQQNLRDGEEIPKGHTRILQVGRKLYMASQGFHDFKEGIDTLPNYRGAHLFSYDLDTGAFDDVSRTLPGGVLVEHQGVVALNWSPEHELLVGLAHPHGDIVLFDPRENTVRKVVPGIPWQLNRMVSREIVVTRTGKVYTYRGPEDPDLRETTNEVWVYDIGADTMTATGQLLKGGFWNGQAVTRDRNTIYLSTVSGELYSLDVSRGTFTSLGPFLDKADRDGPGKYHINYFYGISLDARGTALVGLPLIGSTAGAKDYATRLTSYSIPKNRFTKLLDTDVEVFTGSNHRDRSGNLYLAAFDWDHNCNLAVLTPA
ncbi:MAG: hypothetical protein QG622_3736 [Actinomycetota bacterium]|nr:hypothetical protein [Actinomycetota bacterium]